MHSSRRPSRRVPLAAPLLVLALVAAACGGGGGSDAAAGEGATAGEGGTAGGQDLSGVTLRVGDQVHVEETLLSAAGQLEDLPYEVSWTDFPAGPPLMEALNAGEIDLGRVGDTPPVFAQAAGTEFQIVSASRPVDPETSALAIVVPEGSDIADVADLDGQRVAFTEGSSAHYLLIRALGEANLTIDDVEPVPLVPPDALAAFQGGDVDAWAIWDPFAALAEEGGAERIATGAGLVPGYGFQVARTGALDDPALAAAIGDFLRRYQAAAAWAVEHREEWSELYAQNTGLPAEVVESSFERFETTWVPITDQIVADQQEEADTFFDAGLIPEAIDVGQVFDTRYADQLATEGAS